MHALPTMLERKAHQADNACRIECIQRSDTVATPEKKRLAGVLPVFQTPYHDDESIDFVTLEREIHWLFDRGADGIVMAMVSELLRLSSEEREQLATAACRFGRDRGSVVVSVGAEASILAERYARQVRNLDAARSSRLPERLAAEYRRIVIEKFPAFAARSGA